MNIRTILLYSLLSFLVFMPDVHAQEPVDYVMIDKIRQEWLNRSQVMDHMFYIAEMYGSHPSNSPVYNQAANWARNSFEDWGADETKLEPYRPICPSAGSAAHMHEPQYQPFISYAVRPTRGTNGKVMSDAVFVNTGALYSKSDLQEYKRKLRNKIVFI